MCTSRDLVMLADPLHGRAVDGQLEVFNRVSPEVIQNLDFLPYIEGQVLCTMPLNKFCHFLSVECFLIVSDEDYHSCVIWKLDVIRAELSSAVVDQKCEEHRAGHTALWGTCARYGSARGAVGVRDSLRSSY